MSFLAQFEGIGLADDRRSSERRSLRLTITASSPESPDLAVTVHDLSETGMLLETRVPLAAGQKIQIFLPIAGAVDTTIVWNSHQFYGCQFEERVPRAAVSAALLRSVPRDEAPEGRHPQKDVSAQLRDLNARIERVVQDLDRTIEQLSSERASIPSRDPEEVLAAALPPGPILPPPAAEMPPQYEPEPFVEQEPLEVGGTTQTVVIIALILAGLAALLLIAALLAFPLA